MIAWSYVELKETGMSRLLGMTAEEQLKALSERLAALEAQLQAKSRASGATRAASPGQVTIRILKERKLWSLLASEMTMQ